MLISIAKSEIWIEIALAYSVKRLACNVSMSPCHFVTIGLLAVTLLRRMITEIKNQITVIGGSVRRLASLHAG